jgi:hypothetical protein
MSLIDRITIEDEKRKEKELKAKMKAHKCYGCVWGKWAGNKYSCMFQKCAKYKE